MASETGYPEHRLVRVDANGVLDTTFAPALSATRITSIHVLADGSALVAGRGVYSTVSRGVVRLRANGALDPGFATTGLFAAPRLDAMAVLPDGRLLVGGSYVAPGQLQSAMLVRLRANGALDPTFAADIRAGGEERSVRAIQVQSDGRILIAGQFDTVGGLVRSNIARLLPDGAVDPTFAPGMSTDEPLDALLLQSDGRVMLGGSFHYVNGIRLPGLARLNADGSIDLGYSFQAAPRMFCHALLSQADGRVIAGGSFCRRGPGDDIDEFEYCYGVLRLELDPLPHLQATHLANQAAIQLRASVLPGRAYVLQASMDMRDWTPLQTNTVVTSSPVIQFGAQDTTSSPSRFYRLTEQP
jgi:uncharacterized delta-60 repeat protein